MDIAGIKLRCGVVVVVVVVFFFFSFFYFILVFFFFFQAEDGIRDKLVTGVQTCALPIYCCEMCAVGNHHPGFVAHFIS